MHVLVTGGAGYLGSILVEHLLDAGHRVTVFDRLLYGQASLLHLCARSGFDFARGDVRDETVLAPLVRKADALIPLAAVVGAGACDADPQLATSVNLDAIRLLLRLRSPSQLVVFPNTNSGYGTRSGATFCTEETPLEPISLYGRTKVDAEQAVLDAPLSVSLRLATVFGMSPRMRLDLLVNHFVYAAVTDGYLVIFEQHFKRNFIHVRDVADCFVHAVAQGKAMAGRAYNAGLDEANLSKGELAELIQRFVPGFYLHFAEVGVDPDKRNYIVSNARLREAGFAARRSLEAGVAELVLGYRMMGRHPWKNV
ncbi:MAG: NAD(P)-dependent oxidoreductase [Pirellulales bacterium]|nr:NAD(P)-dependent oxidoreductase [Pirellulales bacterium]